MTNPGGDVPGTYAVLPGAGRCEFCADEVLGLEGLRIDEIIEYSRVAPPLAGGGAYPGYELASYAGYMAALNEPG